MRWSVEGPQHSRAFRTRVEADRFRSFVVQAVQRGEPFSIFNGEPESWSPQASDVQCHEWARRWLAEQWHEWQPRTRFSAVEALARFVPLAVVRDVPAAPAELRRYLAATLPPSMANETTTSKRGSVRHRSGSAISAARPWPVSKSSLGKVVTELSWLPLRRVGFVRRRSRASGVRSSWRSSLPIPGRRPCEVGPQRKAVRVRRTVDVRTLPDPDTMARALSAMVTHQPASATYQAMTAVAYYAGLRPSEVVMLRCSALVLPDDGWGALEVREADISFDESGEPKTGPPVGADPARARRDAAGADHRSRSGRGRSPLSNPHRTPSHRFQLGSVVAESPS